MKLTPEQRKIIDLVNQLPDDIKENTLAIISQMRVSAETTKKDLKNVMMSPDVTKEEKEILEKYKATKKVIDKFHKLCLKLPEKETPDLWDRTALSVWSISEMVIPLLKIYNKQVWFSKNIDRTIDSIKKISIDYYFKESFFLHIRYNKDLNTFKSAIDNTLFNKIKRYNEEVANGSKAVIDIWIDINNIKDDVYTTFKKFEKFKENKEFIDKMWDNFVKDFLQKAPAIKTNEDKAWFFEQLFNIAYHSADYMDYIKNDRNIAYVFNYQFLHNNFDIEKTAYYDFQVDHIDKSTTYSNLVYKWAEQLGIKKLKILVGKYLIKP